MYKNYKYYGNGDLQDEKTIPDNSSQYLLKHYDYDNSCGLSTTTTITGTDAAGVLMPQQRVTIYNYDNNYRFVEETTNPLSQVSTKSYYAETGNVEFSIGVDLLGTRYIYDEFRRIKEITTPRQGMTGSGTTQTFYEYANGNSNEPVGCSYKITTFTPGSPFIMEFYDCFNRLLRTMTEKLESATVINKILKDKIYETGTSRLKYESLPYYFGASNPTFKQYNYSPSDLRLSSTIEDVYGNSKTTSYTYAGNIVMMVRPGLNTSTSYNMRGQVLNCFDANGTYVKYQYYSNGKPKYMGNGDSYSTFEYDAWANNIMIDDLDAGKNNYEYNAFGELTRQVDASANEFTMEYNELGQLTLKTENPTGLIVTTSYKYKLWGNAGANNLESQTKSDGYSIEYKYDDNSSGVNGAHVGDLYECTKSDGSVSLTTQYSYDMYGRVEFKTFPSPNFTNQLQIKNIYNNIGNLIEIDDFSAQPATILWSNPRENALGQPEGYNFGDAQYGIDAKFGYQDHFPSSREFRNNGTPFWKENYIFNIQTGNLTERAQPLHSLIEDFYYDTYDKQLEHVSCSNGCNLDIIYGPQGKIASKSDAGTYTYDCASVPCNAVKMLESPTQQPYGLNTQTLKYTAFNKVNNIEDNVAGPTNLHIYYGPDEERFKTDFQDYNSNHKYKYFTEDYEYIPAGPITPQERQLNYINSPYGIVAVVETDGSGNKSINYIGTDYLGSYNVVFDPSANILNELSFDAWGRLRYNSGASINYNSIQYLMFDRGYTGHEYLQEFQLINMNGRMYDPFIGQMLSPDNFNVAPLSSIGLNRFAYALNNPMKYTDPSGYTPTDGGYLPSSFYTSSSTYSYTYSANYTTYSYTSTTTTSTYNYQSTVNSGYYSVTYDNTLIATTFSTQSSLSSDVYGYLNTDYSTSYTTYSFETSAGDYKLNGDAIVSKIYYNREAIEKGFKGAEIVGGLTAAGRSILLEHREALSYIERVGMSANAKAITFLNSASSYLGSLSKFGAGLSTYLDYDKLKTNRISLERFDYNLTGTGAALGVEAMFGPLAGSVTGASFWIGQKMYDGYTEWSIQMSKFLNDMENGLNNGWTPRY